ncbi:MAG: DUF4349 domain-containing protein [Firmicutes bacterium]|nr:DUF4349 domain-containing protein [Bacillota bacterium]
MKKVTIIILSICMSACMILMMSGCSGKSSSGSAYREDADASYSASYQTTEAAYEEYEYANAEEYKSEESNQITDTDVEQNQALMNAKLIYTAYMELETTEFDNTVSAIKNRVDKAGGYIENSNLSNYGSYRYIYYTLRVPSGQYRYFCDTAGELGNIRSFNENVQNVSESYYDTENRLASAQAKMETLQELMKKAETMEDIITIQNAISDTQYEIDYYSGTLRRYDSLVSFSTINIEVREVSRLSGTEEPPIGFGQELSQAFNRGINNFVTGCQNLLISVARHFIGWLIFIVIVVIVIIVVKAAIKKDKAKKEQMRQAMMAQQMNMPRPPQMPIPTPQEESLNASGTNQGTAGRQ